MASHYRVDYASTSPRTECVNCKQVIRSGELRFMGYNTYRHVDCVTSLEVLKLWQHCKSLDALPGMAQLDYADRQQLQTLFRTLMLSTPMHARSKMAAAAAAAAAAAEAAAVSSSNAAAMSVHSHLSHAPYREASDASMMMESPPSAAITLSAQSVSPPVEPLRLNSAGHALPQGQPALSATPSVLAGYLSNLSCSTPTPPQLSHSLQPPGSGSGHCNGSGFPVHSSSSSLLSPPSLAHRPLYRDVSSSSSHSSPAMQSRSLAAPSLTQQGFDSRSVSPFGGALQPLHPFPQQHQQQQQPPPSPHSNQTSPVPFAHLHLHSRGPSASGTASATSASSGSASGQHCPSSLLFSSPFGHAPGAASSSSSSSSSFHHPRSKRKLASCIPEGEESTFPAGGGGECMSVSPAISAAQPSPYASRADEMMDQGEEDGGSSMANKRRRMRNEIAPLSSAQAHRPQQQQQQQQQHQSHQPASVHMPLFFAGSLQTPQQQHHQQQQLHHHPSAHVPAL